ncbi:STAS domain-containing protein [Streptomyces sp. NPDC051207]|uniref:STAS domain-containing protein n=1 Tax=Streptomyces sp. NPDC051207 TaxID=3154641 RepID=UPI0034428316
MTTYPDGTFDLTMSLDDAGDAHIRITGDLDWGTAGDLTEAARTCMKADPPPRHLHLDCARMRLCDSSGLSALLMIHRTTTEAATRLHLDNRPPALDRLLEMTGTTHLFADPASHSAEAVAPCEPERTDTARQSLPPQRP